MKRRKSPNNVPADEIKRLLVGVAFKNQSQPVEECPICGKVYHQKRPWQKFCSSKCRGIWSVQARRVKGVAVYFDEAAEFPKVDPEDLL